MLVPCPECGSYISDKATSCPQCGFPIINHTPNSSKGGKPARRKRQKLPNGFGRIAHIKGRNLRKPYRVLVTVGKTPEGKLIAKSLKPESYFATYNDAYKALMEYHDTPIDLTNIVTAKQLYEKWSKVHYARLANPAPYKSAWEYSSAL